MCTNEFGIGGTNERGGITMHNLDFIADPLIGMNPITSKYEVKVILHLGDEERRCNRLASNGQLHRSNPLGTNGITSSNVCHVCLDELFVRPTKLLVE